MGLNEIDYPVKKKEKVKCATQLFLLRESNMHSVPSNYHFIFHMCPIV
jgi:hypothetical protein